MSGFQVMPRLTHDEYVELEQSITEVGVQVPITVAPDGTIIDGHHRDEIARKHDLHCPRVTAQGDEAMLRGLAFSLNLHRRHLSREQRRDLIAESLRSDPQMSNREHARRTGASTTTVGSVREGMEDDGRLSKLDSRTSADGRTRPATQPPHPAPEPDTFTCWACEHDYPTDQATEVPEGPICGDCLDTYDTPPEYPDGRPVGFEPGDLDALNVPAPNPGPAKPKRRPITDQARDAGWELRKAVERLERIAEDDRFTANASKVAPHMRSHLTNAIEVCQDLLDRINTHQGV